MLPKNFYSDVIRNLKSSSSCIDICRFSLGINVSYEGQCIHAPSFIRQGDSHPSFAVYRDHAFDYATGKYYDIFELLMLGKGIDFPQAFQEIAGYPLSSILPKSSPQNDIFRDNLIRLAQNIKDWHKALLNTPKALDYLKSRGISQETALKFYLGYDSKSDRLVIPFFKNGQPRYYSARDLSGHGTPKYLHMPVDYGCPKIPFGLQSVKPKFKKKQYKAYSDIDGSDEQACTKSSTLILTEGPIDAITFMQDGWSGLASGGGSFGASNKQLILDTARMYDRVCLAYDNDQAGQDFQLKIARWLLGEQIPFVCVSIPHSVNGHVVKDINDYYCAGGDFFSLVKAAENGISFVGGKINTMKEIFEFLKSLAGYASSWDLQELFDKLASRTKGSLAGEPDPENPDTMDATPLFSKSQLRAIFRAAGGRATDKELMRRVLKKHQLIYSTDGKFYEYNHRYWEQKTKETVKRYISHVLGEKATEGRCGAVMSLMKMELEDDTPFNAQHVVTFPNGVLMLDEPDPEKRFVPHSPDFRCTFMEDFLFDASAKFVSEGLSTLSHQVMIRTEDEYLSRLNHSVWMNFLKSIFPRKCDIGRKLNQPIGDSALIREAQKMCGYIYFTDNNLEQTFMLLGKGGNGKSTFMQIIEEVVGSDFCTHLRPNRLASSFDPIVLRNSILNICHEASKDLEGAEETLKAVSSGNPIMASYKGQDTISFKPRAKWIISANSPMDVKDVSYGFTRRMTFFPFLARFDGQNADVNLLDKLRKEKSLIFNWMYEGYLMLKNGEKFTPTEEQNRLKGQVQEYVDHTLTFVREYFVEGDYVDCLESLPGAVSMYTPMRKLPTDRTMYQWYLKWCKSTNTEPLPRYVALGRINEALSVKCPQMKIIRATEKSTGRERDTYVMPDFAEHLESASIYDDDAKEQILDVFAQAVTGPEKITPQGTGTEDSTRDSQSRSQEGKVITPSEQRASNGFRLGLSARSAQESEGEKNYLQ